MSFLIKGGKKLLAGAFGLLGSGVSSLFKGGKKQIQALPRPADRDDAAALAERDRELARRRGASADRITGASGEPAGGLGRLIMGS